MVELYDGDGAMRCHSNTINLNVREAVRINVKKLYKCGNYELVLCIQLLSIFDYIC